MSELSLKKFYSDAINLKDVEALEVCLLDLLHVEIKSISDLEQWIADERRLRDEMNEAITGHRIDFFRDNSNSGKRDLYLHDQTIVQPLLTKYQAKFDEKFCNCPFTKQLNDKKYGMMRKARKTKVELFREENIPLVAREQELIIKYSEIMGGLKVDWEGETKTFSFAKAQVDHSDRIVRERAWRAMAEARSRVKSEMDEIMTELVSLRHQMAIHAGFENYRDYMFEVKNREYRIQDCYEFHQSVEKFVIPTWKSLARIFQVELVIDSYRPWDMGPCTLQGEPFCTVTELMDGIEKMLEKTDSYFLERFQFMRMNGLLDLESRDGKSPGAFCDPLPATQNAFIFSNFSSSFVALIALIHEFGHAINDYLQFTTENGLQEYNHREEIAELYSHGLELLLLDKLDIFYTNPFEFKNAKRALLHRTFRMLINPLAGDQFQHWLYTHPNHTNEERDAKFLEINQRLLYNPVDLTGLKAEIGASWMDSIHYIAYPFYQIEYAMSELGALQLLQIYREDPEKAITLFKQGASADSNQSISQIYQETGVQFNFSGPIIKKTAQFVENLMKELQ